MIGALRLPTTNERGAEPVARANAARCHDPCLRRARAIERRGSSVTLAKEAELVSQRGNLVESPVFSITLPSGWRRGIVREDVEAPERDALFENAYDCSVRITIGKKSEEVSASTLLTAAWKNPESIFPDLAALEFSELYSKRGIGKSISGMISDQRVCFRYFVFAAEQSLCLLREFWIEANWKFFSSDFEELGQSIRIHDGG